VRHQDTWTMNSQVKVIEMYKTKKRKNTLLRYSVGVARKGQFTNGTPLCHTTERQWTTNARNDTRHRNSKQYAV